MKKSILVFLCLAALAACTFATVGSIAKCDCLRLTDTVLQPRRIQGFQEQKKDGRCPVDAVVFTTIKGKKVCSDPAKIWVKKAIKKLKSRRRKKEGKSQKTKQKEEHLHETEINKTDLLTLADLVYPQERPFTLASYHTRV